MMNFILILCRPFKGEKPTFVVSNKQTKRPTRRGGGGGGRWLVFRHLQTNFFQTWCGVRDFYVLHFDLSLDNLNFFFEVTAV